MMEKLLSKRGQLSMEVGILVAAAVAVAAVAAYYYISNIKNSLEDSTINITATNTINRLEQTASNYIEQIPSSLEQTASNYIEQIPSS